MPRNKGLSLAFDQAPVTPTDRTMNFTLNVTHADTPDTYFPPNAVPGNAGNATRSFANGSICIAPTAGTLRNLAIRGDVNAAGAGETIIVNVNGVDTTISAHAAAGSRNGNDTTHTYVVAANDEISLHVDATSDGGWSQFCAALELVP